MPIEKKTHLLIRYGCIYIMRCTHVSCFRDVFALTLCTYHYRIYKGKRCLLCTDVTYHRGVCSKHYRLCRRNNDFPLQEKCTKCSKTEYLDNLCLAHFKEKYKTDCVIVGCKAEPFRKGLCCKHYFRKRRRK